MEKQKICLKGFKNLVTVDDFRDEITAVDFILNTAQGKFKKQMFKYKHRVQNELDKFWKPKEQSL